MNQDNIIGEKRQEIYKNIEKKLLENKNIFIYGNSSIGKSELINIFVKKHDYDIVTLNDLDNFTIENITKFFNINLNIGVVESFFTKQKKKIFLLDNYNDLLSEEYGIQNLVFSYLKQKKKLLMPIVIIMTQNNKFSIVKYKKYCNIFNYECPTDNELKETVIKIYKEKKKNINTNLKDKSEISISNIEVNLINLFLNECYYDMRLIMINLDSLIYNYNEYKKQNNNSNFIDIKTIINKNKLVNLSLNDIIQKYFNNDFDLNDIIHSNNDFLLYSILEHIPYEIILNRSNESKHNDNEKIEILDTLINMNNNFSDYIYNDESEKLNYLRKCYILEEYKKYPNYKKLKNNFHRNYKPSNICLKNMQYSNKIKQLKEIIENSKINGKNIVSKEYNIYIIDFLNSIDNNNINIYSDDNLDNNEENNEKNNIENNEENNENNKEELNINQDNKKYMNNLEKYKKNFNE